MNRKILIGVLVVGVLIVVGWFLMNQGQGREVNKKAPEKMSDSDLKIVSTKPDSLEGATILPTQGVEVTFNKPISISNLKYKIEPEFEHSFEATGSASSSYGTTFKLTPKKALELGSNYTLFIQSDTSTDDGKKLNQEYIYHISTLKYRGN